MADLTTTDLRIVALNAAVQTRTPNVLKEAQEFFEFLTAGDTERAAVPERVPDAPADPMLAVVAAAAKIEAAGKKTRGKA